MGSQMARAGFYFVGDGEDNVRCFMCLKELDGWEETDDAMAEHKKVR